MSGIVRSEFATTDPEAAHAMVTAAYADNTLRVSGSTQDFRFEQSRVDLGEVRIDGYYNTVTTEYELEPFGTVLVARVLENTIDAETDGVERRLHAGDIYLPARPDKANFTRLHGARVILTSVDVPPLEAVDPEEGNARIARLDYAPLAPGSALRWQGVVDFVTGLAARDDAAASSLVLGAARRLLAASLLDAFAPDADTEPRQARTDAQPATIRRALAYVEANPDLDIGVADIARAAHVSVRALQLAFRRHLGTTPMRHLRRIRLDLAHADLRAAVPGDGTTVTDVAMRWGYASPSRFAADYRAMYGRHPHQTLRVPAGLVDDVDSRRSLGAAGSMAAPGGRAGR